MVKIPANVEGFKALTELVSHDVKLIDVIYTLNQAVLGQNMVQLVSPFVGGLDTNGHTEEYYKRYKKVFLNLDFSAVATSMRNVVYAQMRL